jgi:hypothetical protein
VLVLNNFLIFKKWLYNTLKIYTVNGKITENTKEE